jgi:transcriptional regulator with XRE-family HTH domain
MELKPIKPSLHGAARKFGAEVRAAREAKGWSLDTFDHELGKKLGRRLGQSYFSRLERAETRPPGDDVILAMAELLGMNGDELLALAGRLRREILAAIWSSPGMPGVIAGATAIPPGAAARMAQAVAAFYAEGDD